MRIGFYANSNRNVKRICPPVNGISSCLHVSLLWKHARLHLHAIICRAASSNVDKEQGKITLWTIREDVSRADHALVSGLVSGVCFSDAKHAGRTYTQGNVFHFPYCLRYTTAQ